MTMRLTCPHCHGEASIRTSRELADTVREAHMQCHNVECAHTWVIHVSAVRTIAPSMTPNPRVYIPYSPRTTAAQAADAQLELSMDHPAPRAAVP